MLGVSDARYFRVVRRGRHTAYATPRLAWLNSERGQGASRVLAARWPGRALDA
jgi:hypothetical protein